MGQENCEQKLSLPNDCIEPTVLSDNVIQCGREREGGGCSLSSSPFRDNFNFAKFSSFRALKRDLFKKKSPL